MSQLAFNWQMFFAFWGLVIFCGLSFLVNCYLFRRHKKIFQQNENILLQLSKTTADVTQLVSSTTTMGQRIISMESNMIAVFNQFERRLKDQSNTTVALTSAASSKAQSKAEASLLQLLSD